MGWYKAVCSAHVLSGIACVYCSVMFELNAVYAREASQNHYTWNWQHKATMANKSDVVVEEVRLRFHMQSISGVCTMHAVQSAPCDIALVAAYNGVFCEDTTGLLPRQRQVCSMPTCTSIKMQKQYSKKRSDVCGNVE